MVYSIPASIQGHTIAINFHADYEFKFAFNDEWRLQIDEKGKAEWINSGRTKTFVLPIGQDGNLAHEIFFFTFKQDLVFIYKVYLDEFTAVGEIVRFDHKTLKKKWEKTISINDLFPPRRAGNAVYLSGSTFVAKLNLDNGKIIWRQNLSNMPFAFEYFSGVLIKPYIDQKNNTIVFPKIFRVAGEIPTNLIVDIESGEILNNKPDILKKRKVN